MTHTHEHWIQAVRAHDRRVTIVPNQDGHQLVWRVLGDRPTSWPAHLQRQYVTDSRVAESPVSPVPEIAPVVAVGPRSTMTSTTTSSSRHWLVPVLVVLGLVAAVLFLTRRS